MKLILAVTIFHVCFTAKQSVRFLNYGFPESHNNNNNNAENRKLELKVICHGLNASSNTFWYEPMIKKFQERNFSVIAVDWKDLADDGYVDAIIHLNTISEKIVDEILKSKRRYGIDLGNVHLIGHSLGAHITGYAGKSVFKRTGEKVGRITGLDPAGPGFHSLLKDNRLSEDDAQFVDVIHTDTDFLGIGVSIGHADFYPNGGALQNKCDVIDLGCSHKIAPEYFIESITSNDFVSRKCTTYLWFVMGYCNNYESAVMGLNCDPSSRGDYYLLTNSKPPFGKG